LPVVSIIFEVAFYHEYNNNYIITLYRVIVGEYCGVPGRTYLPGPMFWTAFFFFKRKRVLIIYIIYVEHNIITRWSSINIWTTNARARRTKFVFRKRNYRIDRIYCIYTPQQCNLTRAQFLHNNAPADIIRAINHLIISCVYIIIIIIIVRPWSRSIVFLFFGCR